MILEIAVLHVKSSLEASFESDFRKAGHLISSIPGYEGHSLKKCIEHPGQYLLMVNWATLEDHTVGFRQSPQYQEWKKLLHHYYDPFPTVEHYETVFESPTQSFQSNVAAS